MIGWKWNFLCSPLPLPQKLINISSEVMNIHIIPTQTRHFQTSYTKKVSHFHSNLLTWIECRVPACLLGQSVLLPEILCDISSVFSSQVSTCPGSRLRAESPILSWWVALLQWLHSGSLQGYDEMWLSGLCNYLKFKYNFYFPLIFAWEKKNNSTINNNELKWKIKTDNPNPNLQKTFLSTADLELK